MLLVTICIVLFVCKYLWDRRRLYGLAMQMVGPTGYPLVGSAYIFADSTKIVENVTNMVAEYGDLIKFWLGNKLIVFTNNADYIEQILNAPQSIEKGASYEFMMELTGYGLITMKDKEWSDRRKLINPSFHYKVLQKFIPIFNKHIRVLVDNLSKLKGTNDLILPLKKCAMDMICETSMDRDVQTQFGKNAEFLWAWDKGLEIAGDRIFKPWLQNNWIYRFTQHYVTQQKTSKIIHNATRDTIDAKRKATGNENATKRCRTDKDEDFFPNTEKHNLIDRTMKLALDENVLTLNDVHNEINNTLVAGYETTSSSSSYILLLLAMHPHYQQQVYDEIQSIVPTDVEVTHDNIMALTFTDSFIKETLRMFPPIPYLTRACGAEMRVGGFTVPAGVEFALSIHDVHRSARYYRDPNTFNPDNFLHENAAGRHPYSFLPFGGGTRTCIGSKYAQYVHKIVVAHVVRRFRLTTRLKIEDLRFRMNIGLCLLNKHLIELEERV